MSKNFRFKDFYSVGLCSFPVRPLKQKVLEGVQDFLDVMKECHSLREDIEALNNLISWPGKKGPMDSVDGKVKLALTQAYNKAVIAYS